MAGFTKNEGVGYPKVFKSYKSFKKTLQDFFSDSNQQTALERKILAITQKGSASDYVTQL
jgi:hypothetical protein